MFLLFLKVKLCHLWVLPIQTALIQPHSDELWLFGGVCTSLRSSQKQTSGYCVQASVWDKVMKPGGCMVRRVGSKAPGSNPLLTGSHVFLGK